MLYDIENTIDSPKRTCRIYLLKDVRKDMIRDAFTAPRPAVQNHVNPRQEIPTPNYTTTAEPPESCTSLSAFQVRFQLELFAKPNKLVRIKKEFTEGC